MQVHRHSSLIQRRSLATEVQIQGIAKISPHGGRPSEKGKEDSLGTESFYSVGAVTENTFCFRSQKIASSDDLNIGAGLYERMNVF